MGFWGSFLSAFKSIAITVAVDTAALLLGGGSGGSQKAQDLKDKAFRSEAYGSPWSRCRGVVRLQGKDLWGTQIYTSWWKTVSGGLFGIGSKSVRYPKYSASRFIGFGKKLNGGAAVSFLRIWADGKLLYNKQASTGKIIGAVTVTVVGGGQLPGSQFLQITLASGATATINAGDLLIVPGDPQPYTAQTTITASGPTTISVPIWPPLRVNLPGTGQVIIPPVSSSPYDLSSFDPNPHDGSHFNGGFPAPPGGVRFYLGDDLQTQDPLMVQYLGSANVPGYRGLVGVMIHDLELANYGDHFPAITAEIAFDVAAPLFPMVGPIPAVEVTISSLVPEFFALPFSGNSAANFVNPLTPLPYVWVFSQVVVGGGAFDGTIYRVNTSTNQYEASVQVPKVGTFGLTPAGMVADADGALYFIQNNSVLTKIDGFTLNVTKQWSVGFPNIPESIYCWDSLQSLFGNPIIVKLMYVSDWIFDRTVLLRLGVADPVSTENCVLYYDSNGKPVVGPGDPVSFSLNVPNNSMTDDAAGNIWGLAGSPYNFLLKIDCQFNSSIVLDVNNIPQPILALPAFTQTSIDISSVNVGAQSSIQYYSGDDTIVVFGGSNKIGKVSASTVSIIQIVTTAGSGTIKLGQVDVMGTIVINGGTNGVRVDLSSLTLTGSTYTFSNWFPGGTGIPLGGYPVFDPVTDSIWLDASNNGVTYGGLNRIFLDRGNGNGIALDSIITSLMLSAGYSSGQFDVTQVTASGKTCYGVEFDRETFLDSLRKLMLLYTVDAAEIDGKIVFVPRGNSSIVTIPEDDLGALDDPSKYEPRVFELLQDERDTPSKVTIKYYDPLKDSQQATQEAKRTLKAYPSSLSTAKIDTASKQETDIVSPITEFATPVKQLAEILQWDAVASRYSRKFKLPLKYIRYDPTDVVTLNYKGYLLETRLTECDFGSGLAREMQGVSQDSSVYTSTAVASPGVGSGGGTGGTPAPTPSPAPLSYTVSPTYALSEASPTEVDMVQVTVNWSDGRTTIYSARSGGSGFVTVDPGAGNSQLYYVTIYDPNRTGEVAGTPSLTAYCVTTPSAAFMGVPGYVFIGTITITHTGVGVVVTSGGSGNVNPAIGFYVNGSGGSGYSTQIDVVSYATMDGRRATHHLAGSAANTPSNRFYSYVDNSINAFAFVKAAAGWANDILLFDNLWLYHFITELDDVGYSLWTDPTSYKKNEDAHGYPRSPALPISPRFLTAGGAPGRVDFASPNNYGRYVSCSKIDTKNKGAFTSITKPPITMNIDSMGSSVGNLGNIQVVVNERYSGAKQRERFYWAKDAVGGLGFVMWDAALLVSGTQTAGDPTWTPTGQYKIFNWSVHNQLVAGGGVSSSFGCGWGAGWP